jgi:hypothetical protein
MRAARNVRKENKQGHDEPLCSPRAMHQGKDDECLDTPANYLASWLRASNSPFPCDPRLQPRQKLTSPRHSWCPCAWPLRCIGSPLRLDVHL